MTPAYDAVEHGRAARAAGFDSGWKLATAAAVGQAKAMDGASGMRRMYVGLAAMALMHDHDDLATVPLTRELTPALEALYDDAPQPSLITQDVVLHG